MLSSIFFVFALVLFLTPAAATAVPVFFGPTPYLSTADVPAGLYAGGVPVALEDFEDLTVDFGIIASTGVLTSIPHPDLIDSVDADDGSIDGLGSAGQSWFNSSASTGLTFSFPSSPNLPTAAGLVFTDAGSNANVIFEAFGPGMVSLGTIVAFNLADGTNIGTTAEDRFFGVSHLSGIAAVKLTATRGGIEADHVQFGEAVPEPSVALLLGAGIFGIAACGRRRTRR